MRNRRIWGWVVLTLLLLPISCVGRVVYNVPINRWLATQQMHVHRSAFMAVAADLRERGIERVSLSAGEFTTKCGAASCPEPSSETKFILRTLGYPMIYRVGTDVYFAKDSGFQYDMGIALFDEAPRFLHSEVRPVFQLEVIEDGWYFYRHVS